MITKSDLLEVVRSVAEQTIRVFAEIKPKVKYIVIGSDIVDLYQIATVEKMLSKSNSLTEWHLVITLKNKSVIETASNSSEAKIDNQLRQLKYALGAVPLDEML